MNSTFLLYLFLLKSEYKIRHRRQLNSRVGTNPDFFSITSPIMYNAFTEDVTPKRYISLSLFQLRILFIVTILHMYSWECMFIGFIWCLCVCIQTVSGAASLRWGLHLVGYRRTIRLWAIFICLACLKHNQNLYIFSIKKCDRKIKTKETEIQLNIRKSSNPCVVQNIISHDHP